MHDIACTWLMGFSRASALRVYRERDDFRDALCSDGSPQRRVYAVYRERDLQRRAVKRETTSTPETRAVKRETPSETRAVKRETTSVKREACCALLGWTSPVASLFTARVSLFTARMDLSSGLSFIRPIFHQAYLSSGLSFH